MPEPSLYSNMTQNQVQRWTNRKRIDVCWQRKAATQAPSDQHEVTDNICTSHPRPTNQVPSPMSFLHDGTVATLALIQIAFLFLLTHGHSLSSLHTGDFQGLIPFAVPPFELLNKPFIVFI